MKLADWWRNMKIGIDFHGVLNSDPFFKEMGRLFVEAGHEVHIITGARWTAKTRIDFLNIGIIKGIHYTHFISISDLLIDRGEKVHWQDADNPWFDEKIWNKEKAKYCKENNITIHFDDSKEYGKYFSTPYYLKQEIYNGRI